MLCFNVEGTMFQLCYTFFYKQLRAQAQKRPKNQAIAYQFPSANVRKLPATEACFQSRCEQLSN